MKKPKPNTKEYLKQHSVRRPYNIHDIPYIEQLVRYHQSCADVLTREIKQLKELSNA